MRSLAIKPLISLLIVIVMSAYLFYVNRVDIRELVYVEPYLVYTAIGFAAILVLTHLAQYVYPEELKFLRRPLWGFKNTPQGYKDTSLEKHPYVTYTLLAIYIILFAILIFYFYPQK